VKQVPKTLKSQKGKDNGNYKHGCKHTKLYEIWCAMKQRCDNKNAWAYKYYGAKGISVCDEWQNSFESFKIWSEANGYIEGLSIDRIDNNGNYSPSNCRWVTMKEQANNQRNTLRIEYLGVTKTLHEWADSLGIRSATLYYRIYKLGWSIERAFTEKVSLNRHSREIVDTSSAIKALKERSEGK
jgi:hypothetical protein